MEKKRFVNVFYPTEWVWLKLSLIEQFYYVKSIKATI